MVCIRVYVHGETSRKLNFRGLRPIRKNCKNYAPRNLALYGIYLLVWSLGMRSYAFYLIRTRYLCLVGLAVLPCRPSCFRHQLPPLSRPGPAFPCGQDFLWVWSPALLLPHCRYSQTLRQSPRKPRQCPYYSRNLETLSLEKIYVKSFPIYGSRVRHYL